MNTKAKRKRRNMPGYYILCGVIILCLCIYVFPVVFAAITSLKSTDEFYRNIWALPEEILVSNYGKAFQVGRLGEYMINSVIISIASLQHMPYPA